MPISGDKRKILSLQLVAGMGNFVRGFFLENKISQNEIPKVMNCKTLNHFARDLGLKVKVEELAEETVTAPKETPIEIINRTIGGVVNDETANSPRSGIGVALTGDPIVIL